MSFESQTLQNQWLQDTETIAKMFSTPVKQGSSSQKLIAKSLRRRPKHASLRLSLKTTRLLDAIAQEEDSAIAQEEDLASFNNAFARMNSISDNANNHTNLNQRSESPVSVLVTF